MNDSDMGSEWRRGAACGKTVDEDPVFAAAWLVRDDVGADTAKSICKTQCKVRTECLMSALLDVNAQGLRAGFFFDKGTVRRPDARAILKEFGITARTSQKQKIAQ